VGDRLALVVRVAQALLPQSDERVDEMLVRRQKMSPAHHAWHDSPWLAVVPR